MGTGHSTLCPCFHPPKLDRTETEPDPIYAQSGPLDETLGHSFCYVRSSARFVSPTPSDRFLSPTHSLRFDDPVQKPETGFKAISGASVSANAYTPKTVLQVDNIYDSATDENGATVVNVNGFESTALFSALPLQPVPRGGDGFFMSGPIERGALSGPLDSNVPFSAPLGDASAYVKRRKKRVSGIPKALYRNFSVVPVLNFVARKDNGGNGGSEETVEARSESDVQWALGKAGEDRVHVVVSEEQGWLFVGIYDGFNGPDAPEFLMSNLYRCMFNELRGLFWELEEDQCGNVGCESVDISEGEIKSRNLVEESCEKDGEARNVTFQKEESDSADISEVERKNGNLVEESSEKHGEAGKEGSESVDISEVERKGGNLVEESSEKDREARKVAFQNKESEIRPQRRRLWEFLAEENLEDGLDLSGSGRFAFSVDEAISVSKEGSSESRRWMLLSKLKHGLGKRKEGGYGKKLFPWKFGFEDKEKAEVRVDDKASGVRRRRKDGPVDPDSVLKAMERALEVTETAYLDLTNKVLDTYPELALMGSCLLVALMRDEDVYVMNVGDSRAIVAQYEQSEQSSSSTMRQENIGSNMEGIFEESLTVGQNVKCLTALQLSTDHSTSIEEEVMRIKNEHPDDSQCILNDRVKGRLKVTRAFGAGFLKQPKFNDVLLEMFRNEYIGTAPYISCSPCLRHHKLCPSDQFLILSSDGLYQYLSNEEVVYQVESFMEKFPDGDPAQHLIEELLTRAAKKAGMGFHELLDIPQGDRRKYHDDVTVMVISLEGRIWKSSGKYI